MKCTVTDTPVGDCDGDNVGLFEGLELGDKLGRFVGDVV